MSFAPDTYSAEQLGQMCTAVVLGAWNLKLRSIILLNFISCQKLSYLWYIYSWHIWHTSPGYVRIHQIEQ